MAIHSRRHFLFRLSLATAGVTVSSGPAAAFCRAQQPDYVEVETAYGRLRGVRENGVNIIKGVPYAGKISGDRRFRRPAPLEPWTGVRDALRLGPPAVQPPRQSHGIDEPDPAEDCLFLNVWTPANDHTKRPVMFYNHGGGFVTGSGGSLAQDGANLARNFDVVVVQTNHRLGLPGFLFLDELAGEDYAGSGNNGMLDIVDGLKWVHQNIEAFGGDPDNVMIFGESGGGRKTSCLYAMPDAASLFNKASIESGPGVRMKTRELAAETTALLLKTLDITPQNWRKLLELPASALLQAQYDLPRLASARPVASRPDGTSAFSLGDFSPVVDGYVLPAHPFDPVAPEISRTKPLLVGWNEDEYTFFAMASGDVDVFTLDGPGIQKKLESQFGEAAGQIFETYRNSRPGARPIDLYVAIMSVTRMGLGSIEIAEKKAAQQAAPVYLYNFGYKSEEKIPGTGYPVGAAHALDIAFKFNNLPRSNWLAGERPERFMASDNMAGLWTAFARTGKPAAAGQPEWPAYDLVKRPTMRIDSRCEVIYDRYASERELWKSLGYLG